MPQANATYLGDGVYAEYEKDTGMVALAVGSHNNRVVYLEPEVLGALLDWVGKTVKQAERPVWAYATQPVRLKVCRDEYFINTATVQLTGGVWTKLTLPEGV